MGSFLDDPLGYYDKKDTETLSSQEEKPKAPEKPVAKTESSGDNKFLNDPLAYFNKRDSEIQGSTEKQEKPVEQPAKDKVEQFIDKAVEKVARFSPIRSKTPVPGGVDAADVLLQATKDKTAEDFINSGGQEALKGLSSQELKKFSESRKDVILPRDSFAKLHQLQKSQSIIPNREDVARLGEGLKETAKGLATGAYHVGRDLLSTDPESNARLWNDVKSFVSPVFEAVPDVGWTAAKVKAGGTRISDLVAEKFGQSPQQSEENAYQRHLVDAAREQSNKASKDNIYSFYLNSPTAVSGIKAIMRLNSPTADDAVLQKQAEQISQQLADEQQPLDQAVKTLATFTLPSGLGLGGDMAALMNAAPFVKGLAAASGKLLPRGMQEARIASQQAANAEKLAREVEQAGKVSTMGRVAAATAAGIEGLQQAGESFAEAHPTLASVGAAIPKYLPGAVVGYESSHENPLLGALVGAGIERTALGGLAKMKAGEALRTLPRVAADVAEARAASAGGKIGKFAAAGMREESSDLTKKLFGGDRGAKLDRLAQNLADYGREGVNMTALGLATGAINSDNSDQMLDMVENGLIYGFLGKTVHKVLGTDPVDAARRLHEQDIDNYKTVKSLSPEAQNNLRPFTDWGTVVEQAQHNLAKLQQNGGDVAGAQRVLNNVSNANLATREAYRREVLNSLTAAHQLVNGSLRTGQPNIGIELLTTDQIYKKLAEQNPNKPAAELQAMADSSKGIYFPSGAREVTPGAAVPEALKATGADTVFNPLKPTVVVNLNKVMDFAGSQGKSLNEAMSHELGHAIQDIPEFRELNKDVYSKLFDIEFKGPDGKVYHSTKGLYSDKDLVKMFFDNYLTGDEFATKEEKEAWADSRGFMRDGKPDEAKIANYMKDEVMADLNGTAFHLKRVDKLDSGRQHLLDWAAVEQQNNLLARTVNKLMGYGGDGKIGSEPKAFTGAKFSPEILAAHREAVRAMQKLNGMVSTPSKGEVAKAAVSKAQMIKSKALRERYGKDSGLFKTEFKATIFDKDGNAVGTTTLQDPMTKEGTWGEENGNLVQRSGYGATPAELSGVQIPAGGTVKVSREIVLAPDGETPIMLSAKEAQQLSATRDQLIRNAIDGTDDVGTPGRFQPFSADGLSYSGTFTPKQIEAIRSLPENVVPAKVKDTILRFNELIAKGEGHRMLIDYAARLDERGKYKAFSPKIYDVVPIGMGFSKAGNFYVTAVSVTRLLNKLELWADRMPARLSPWGGDREAFFREFADKYLPNHLAGKPGETGLSKDPAVALQKKNIFNDFLNLTRNDAVMNNPDRTSVPRKKGERKKDFDPDRTIMAIRADAVADMLESTATPLPVDYGKQLQNFLPAKSDETSGRGNEEVGSVIRSYTDRVGIPYNPHKEAVSVDEALAKKIADHYEAAVNEPGHPEVKRAYTALANEVVDQWKEFQKAGYTATPWTKPGQPYANSQEMMDDVRNNKHLYYFQTKEGYGETGITDKMRAENPMLQDSGVNFNGAENVPVNDVFRVVHDIVGHGAQGYEFGPKGEFNAYLEHGRMFSNTAKPALAAETLAQNSWVNYGRHLRDEAGNIPKKGEKGYVAPQDRPFAEQKNIALPKELIDAADQHVKNIVDSKAKKPVTGEINQPITTDAKEQTPQYLPAKGATPESDSPAQGARVEDSQARESERFRLHSGLAAVARAAESSGEKGVSGTEESFAARKDPGGEDALREYADENGLWADPDTFFRQWQSDGSEAGGEHQVSFPPNGDVVKRTPNPNYPTWAAYFDALNVHNTLFPKAALNFRGFQDVKDSGGVDIDGQRWPAGLYSEVSQPFLQISRGLSVPETDALMKTRGFYRVRPMEYYSPELGIFMTDLHGGNAVMLKDEKENEMPYVIDSYIRPSGEKDAADIEKATAKASQDQVGTKSGPSFLPAPGETRSVPTQEELNKMKAGLPKHYTEIEDRLGGKKIWLFTPEGSDPIGDAYVFQNPSDPTQLNVISTEVDREYRGQGYGQALYRAVARYAQGIGATELVAPMVSDKAIRTRESLFATDVAQGEMGTEATSRIEPGISYLPAKKGDIKIQHESEEKEGSVGGTLDLVHFGAYGVNTADPKKMGKGSATGIDRAGLPKTYFYVNGTKYEEGIQEQSPYIAKVDGNSIYDLDADPLGLKQTNREDMDKAIKAAGFAGYASAAKKGQPFSAVAMFKPTKLTEALPTDVFSKKEAKRRMEAGGPEIDYAAQDEAFYGPSFLPAKGISAAVELSKTLEPELREKLDKSDEGFFEKFWPSLIKKTGLGLKASSQNLGRAASIAADDVTDWLKTNPQYLDYYHKDWEHTERIIKEAFPNTTPDDILAFRIFTGFTSPSTKLPENMAEALRVFSLWKKDNSIKALQLRKTEKGNIGVGPGPFKLIGPTAANKARSLHVVEDLHNQLGSWQAVSDKLQEPVTAKELNAFNQELGYAGGVGDLGKIRQVVKEATGQDELIPRMFVFGPKIGAYTLNHLGDDRYTTTDIWEGRFIRSYFPDMFKVGTGLAQNVSEHKLFQTFASKFNETFEEKTGLKLSPAALQAARWFFVIAKVSEAGYKSAKSNEAISTYVARYLENGARNTSGDRGGSSPKDPGND